MKGNEEVIAVLNGLLADELTAIHTYILHSEMCENWGYKKLAGLIRKDAREEMMHAEKHMERVLFFDAIPDVYKVDRMPVGNTVPELLETQLGMERAAIQAYNNGIAVALRAGDNGTKEYLEKILHDEEAHELFLDSQLEQIRTMGLAQYLSQQM
jgi:bacterioferritin